MGSAFAKAAGRPFFQGLGVYCAFRGRLPDFQRGIHVGNLNGHCFRLQGDPQAELWTRKLN